MTEKLLWVASPLCRVVDLWPWQGGAAGDAGSSCWLMGREPAPSPHCMRGAWRDRDLQQPEGG